MSRKLAWVLVASGLIAGPANATPRAAPHYVFPEFEQCLTALNAFWRGNHAFYCEFGPNGWYIAYDPAYENAKKGPKNK